MIPAPLYTIKQSLNKAFRLLKPKRASIEAFKLNLVHLLLQIIQDESEAELKAYVSCILSGIFPEPEYQKPENNSSPVCYAHAPELREEFIDPILPNTKAPIYLQVNPPASTSGIKSLTANAHLKQVLQITKTCVWQILSTKQLNLEADTTALEKQINELVYQLYELTPEEIALVEGS
ncbi:DUF7149 domain-containing protein [Adhaeribacter pallidiroseus]|uniref:DUF7149 domain-containing protein n=1 Tax=Adhaeribacter pallidiroseus TaxID=2072847 RepID=A0A369QMG7_9BACT|nr:hypothetical protein [Adhaeribacter pallidiroseus]RDC65530.1 hypothetical protein AHMF7616_04160 [Adhaeribacter pallidiroseus]